MRKKILHTTKKPDIKVSLSAILIFGLLILLIVYYLGLMQNPPEGTKTPITPTPVTE